MPISSKLPDAEPPVVSAAEPTPEPPPAVETPKALRDALCALGEAHYGRGNWWEAMPSAERLGLDPDQAAQYTKAPPAERAKLFLRLVGDGSEPLPDSTRTMMDLDKDATVATAVRALRKALPKD